MTPVHKLFFRPIVLVVRSGYAGFQCTFYSVTREIVSAVGQRRRQAEQSNCFVDTKVCQNLKVRPVHCGISRCPVLAFPTLLKPYFGFGFSQPES
jgi:hypothetical protein